MPATFIDTLSQQPAAIALLVAWTAYAAFLFWWNGRKETGEEV